MRWPWSRRSKPDTDEAEAARRAAEQKLTETTRQQDEINEVSRRLRELRQRNRFADMIVETMRPQPKEER